MEPQKNRRYGITLDGEALEAMREVIRAAQQKSLDAGDLQVPRATTIVRAVLIKGLEGYGYTLSDAMTPGRPRNE